MTTKTKAGTTKAAKATKTPKANKLAPTPEVAAEQAAEATKLNEETAKTATETKAPKVLPTADEALATAKAKNPGLYARVLRVTEQAKDGGPKRVEIECGDPQTKQGSDGQQHSVCEGKREIAVQDLFQVRCCAACADRKVRKARRNRAKTRAKAAKAALKARAE